MNYFINIAGPANLPCDPLPSTPSPWQQTGDNWMNDAILNDAYFHQMTWQLLSKYRTQCKLIVHKLLCLLALYKYKCNRYTLDLYFMKLLITSISNNTVNLCLYSIQTTFVLRNNSINKTASGECTLKYHHQWKSPPHQRCLGCCLACISTDNQQDDIFIKKIHILHGIVSHMSSAYCNLQNILRSVSLYKATFSPTTCRPYILNYPIFKIRLGKSGSKPNCHTQHAKLDHVEYE